MHTVKPRRRSGLLVAAGVSATVFAAMGTVTLLSGSASARESVALTAQPPAHAQGGMTGQQRHRADQLVSAFENSTTEIQYDYAENLHDGRGVTSGRAGFCTGSGDALIVVESYTRRVRNNPLARFLPELRRLARSGSGHTGGLPEHDYAEAWATAAWDRTFRDVQDQVVANLYFSPAMRHADQVGLKTALARAEIYDATIQHGDGDGPDSLGALLWRTRKMAGGTPATGIDEKLWLEKFFQVRTADLSSPANGDTRGEWADSVDRVSSLRRIARTGNYDLNGPISFSVYGDTFTID